MQASTYIPKLINLGLSAYHINQMLRNEGLRTYCFGSYYTVKQSGKYFCFYETDNGVKAEWVDAARSRQTGN